MKKLENRTAIVTGASSGMGKAIATLFALEGAQVFVVDLIQSEIDEVVGSIEKAGGKAQGVVCDVSKEEQVIALFEKSTKASNKLDILVNNAGILDNFYPTDETSNELWHLILNVNLNGPFYTSRLALKYMLKTQKGNIINISSIGGLNGSRAGAAYTTSKHGLIGLSKNIAFMYAQKGIRCNVIAPGGVATNIAKNMNPNKFGYERCISGTSNMPRVGSSEEIAQTALFLASDDSSFINGAVVTADGGWTAY